MPKISGPIKSSVTTTEINAAVTPSASEVNIQQPGRTSQVTEQSMPGLSEKEIKSRVNELKLSSQTKEMQLRSELAKKKSDQDNQLTEVKTSQPKSQEVNMSYNMQYLMLQQSMQDENRKNTLLSNVMETKHSTAKKSINKVR